MRIQDVALEYISLNVFNSYTADKVRTVAELFDRRSGCNNVGELERIHLINFKEQTLAVAKPVTYNGYIGYLKLLGKFMLEEGYVSIDPFSSLRCATLGKGQPKVISDTTLKTATEYLSRNTNSYEPAWFWLTVIRFLYMTGVRRRQLVFIRVADVKISRVRYNFHS
jgi:site-specific recombinase XerD